MLSMKAMTAPFPLFHTCVRAILELARIIPNAALLEDTVQYHTGHRNVKDVRSYNRFVQKAQIYKALFFYDSKLQWPKQNTT